MPSTRLVVSLTAAAIAFAASVACGGAGTPDGPTRPPVIVETTPTTKPVVTKPTTPAAAAKPTKAVSVTQQNATRAAQSYLDMQAFSRKGLINQLHSDAGDGFPLKESTAAVDSLHVNWNEQAAKSAKGYLEMQSFSKKGLIEQLESSAGEGFTHAQAVYGVSKTGL